MKILIGRAAAAISAVIWMMGCDATRLVAFASPASDADSENASGGQSSPPDSKPPEISLRCDPCTDFPQQPLIDVENGSLVPENAAELFAQDSSAAAGVGPCLVEPELGSLFPRNWLRPRFRFIPAANQDLFELRLHSDLEANDLVLYTSATTWTLPDDVWRDISENLVGQPITVTLRGLDRSRSPARVSLATTGALTIAPSTAEGSIVYWTTTGGSALKGFSIGEEGVSDVLRPEQTQGQCIGCHTSAPDGSFVAVAVSADANGGDPAHIELRSGDGAALEPSYVTAQAMTLLSREQQHMPTFSKARWSEQDKTMVTILNGRIAWTDLQTASQAEGVGWGLVSTTSDPNTSATHPVFNHTGTAIAYTSVGLPGTVAIADETDVYVVSFDARQGGMAQPLKGADTPEANEYYPAFSPDDELIVFTKATPARDASQQPFAFASASSTYSNQRAEVFVISAKGGVPQRLAANDPPSCTGKQSPGITNSWAKWSPTARTIDDKTYYWLTFSSNRIEASRPQLYVSAVVVDASGQISSYPALYLWNQPDAENNHTPAWDVFDIPPVVVK